MSASLVGSEMCIRDRRAPADVFVGACGNNLRNAGSAERSMKRHGSVGCAECSVRQPRSLAVHAGGRGSTP
eukprot:14997510-Alexandrium_andersonii.AAC.1